MAHVLVLDSVNEDIFVCGMCKSVFNCLEQFIDHKNNKCIFGRDHSDESVKISDISETQPDCVVALSNDPNNVPSKTPEDLLNVNTCTVCNKEFKTRKGLLAHSKSHCTKSYQCLVCGRGFILNSHLARHKLCHKVWPEGLSETTPKCSDVDLLSFSCPYCPQVFSTYNMFRSHLKNHQSIKKYKCIQDDCKNFYDTYEMLLNHVASSHITQTYICHVCNEPFDSLQSIAIHDLTHNDNIGKEIQTKQFKCSLCDAVFTKAEKLSLHMLTENHNKVCIHCKRIFASDKRLRLHLQIHRDLKPFQCSICQKSFHMKKYLSTHMLKHGAKEHICPICACMFYRVDALQRHMRSHNSSKWISCPFKDTLNCKKEFSRKDKLKLHIQKDHNYGIKKDIQIKEKLISNKVNVKDNCIELLSFD